MGQTRRLVRGKIAKMSPITVLLVPVSFLASVGKKGATCCWRVILCVYVVSYVVNRVLGRCGQSTR